MSGNATLTNWFNFNQTAGAPQQGEDIWCSIGGATPFTINARATNVTLPGTSGNYVRIVLTRKMSTGPVSNLTLFDSDDVYSVTHQNVQPAQYPSFKGYVMTLTEYGSLGFITASNNTTTWLSTVINIVNNTGFGGCSATGVPLNMRLTIVNNTETSSTSIPPYVENNTKYVVDVPFSATSVTTGDIYGVPAIATSNSSRSLITATISQIQGSLESTGIPLDARYLIEFKSSPSPNCSINHGSPVRLAQGQLNTTTKKTSILLWVIIIVAGIIIIIIIIVIVRSLSKKKTTQVTSTTMISPRGSKGTTVQMVRTPTSSIQTARV